MFYTQGFHPKPKVTSAPPLPLGTIGLNEPVDLVLVDPPEEKELLRKLADATPADFRFHRAELLGPTDKSIGKGICAASYVSLVPLDRESLAEGVERLMASASWEVERKRKGRIRPVDLRSYLTHMEILPRQDSELLLPQAPDRTPLAFTLSIPGSGGARPLEILQAVCGSEPRDPWTVRVQFVFD